MSLIELVQNLRWLPNHMTYRPPDTPMHGGSQDYFTMQLCGENFDVDLALWAILSLEAGGNSTLWNFARIGFNPFWEKKILVMTHVELGGG